MKAFFCYVTYGPNSGYALGFPTDTPLQLSFKGGEEIEGMWSVYFTEEWEDKWTVSRDGGKTWYSELPPLGVELQATIL